MCPSYNAWKAQSQYPPPKKKLAGNTKEGSSKRALDCAMWDKNPSLVLTSPSSPSDKTHFPFISLYHKHKPGGRPGLEAVEARPWVLIYLMIYCKFPLLSERSTSNRKDVDETWGICLFKLKLTALIPACILLLSETKLRIEAKQIVRPESKMPSAPHSFAEPWWHLTLDFHTLFLRVCASTVTDVTAVIHASAVWVLDVWEDDGIGKEVHLSL